jgi:hypothetical protein
MVSVEEGVGGVNMVHMYTIFCVHMYVSRKMRPVETIPGMRGGRKGNDGRVNSTIFDLL